MCGDGLFIGVPPLASDALLTTLHPLLETVLQTVHRFEISCLAAPFSWLEKAQKSCGARSEFNSVLGLKKSGSVEPHYNIRHTVQISPHEISGLFQP
jgi:hypothetical protein